MEKKQKSKIKNTKNELGRIKNIFLSNFKSYGLYDGQLIGKIINNAKDYERPDIVSIAGDTVYGIEHFEYDCYEHKKGSKYKEDVFKMSNELRKKAVSNPNVMMSCNKKIETKGNIHLYLDNFNKSFVEHYEKIDEYINNTKLKYPNYNDIKILFLAEDVNPIGTAMQDCDGIKILFPYMFQRSLDLIESCNKLYGVLFTYYDACNQGIFIITKKDYKEIRNKYILDENRCEIITANPQSSMNAIYLK